MIFATEFDNLEDCCSYREVKLKTFSPTMKTSCPLAENINETPVICNVKHMCCPFQTDNMP